MHSTLLWGPTATSLQLQRSTARAACIARGYEDRLGGRCRGSDGQHAAQRGRTLHGDAGEAGEGDGEDEEPERPIVAPDEGLAVEGGVGGVVRGHVALVPEARAELERQARARGAAGDRHRRPHRRERRRGGDEQEEVPLQHLQPEEAGSCGAVHGTDPSPTDGCLHDIVSRHVLHYTGS